MKCLTSTGRGILDKDIRDEWPEQYVYMESYAHVKDVTHLLNVHRRSLGLPSYLYAAQQPYLKAMGAKEPTLITGLVAAG